jgi:hypothetical protein
MYVWDCLILCQNLSKIVKICGRLSIFLRLSKIVNICRMSKVVKMCLRLSKINLQVEVASAFNLK